MAETVRQNFHEQCENALNKQINMELHASYVYLSMAYHFDRSDVALKGLHEYFKKASSDEREHAMKFLSYQNKRGGKIILEPIAKPDRDDWLTAKDAMIEALKLEKQVNENLLSLHGLASEHNDPSLLDFLESEFLQEQVESIKEITDHVTNLERVGEGLGTMILSILKKCYSTKRAGFQFNELLEKALNAQINTEFQAFYSYLSMASYFGRVDIGLIGCEEFFKRMYTEEYEHALKFVEYIKTRGGGIRLSPILPPKEQENWLSPLNAFERSLQMEIQVGEKLMKLKDLADCHNDSNASDFIVREFLDDQVKSINDFERIITILKGIREDRPSIGTLIFDDYLIKYILKKKFAN